MTFEWSRTPPSEPGYWWWSKSDEPIEVLSVGLPEAGLWVWDDAGNFVNVADAGGEWARVATPEQVAAMSAALRDACDKCPGCGGDPHDVSDDLPNIDCRVCAGWRRALEGQK
jgi:hypothetical protein